ncbi:MAG TPA: YkgJ family cysteine cluster protein [Cyclobacteriaceae bacterium]|nr:YkgJ family cysteine cluster protein [Cyclobacteriaceae bacterium]
MTLAEKVESVEILFQTLDGEIAAFQNWSGLHCTSGCGKCCLKPDITATVLEFLPLAYHAFKENHAVELYERVKGQESSLCIMLNQAGLNGMCSNYHSRGMICRVFGYSARMNKYGKPEMMTCKIIKTEQEENYNKAVDKIGKGTKDVTIAENYYRKLVMIDDHLGRTLYPVNTAIEKALEIVLQYHSYREVDQ